MPLLKYSLFAILFFFASCQSTQTSTETKHSEEVETTENTKKEDRTSSIKKLPPRAFQAQLTSTSSPLLLDVRTPKEFNLGHLDHALNINFHDSDFATQLQSVISVKRPVFVYCKAGGRSANAAKVLQKLGCKEIYDLAGGYTAWSKASAAVLPDTLKVTTQ